MLELRLCRKQSRGRLRNESLRLRCSAASSDSNYQSLLVKLYLEHFGGYSEVVGFGLGAGRFADFAGLIVVADSDFVIAPGSVVVAGFGTARGGMCIRGLLH